MADPAAWWPYAALAVGAVVTYAFRGLGVALSGRLRTEGPAFAYAGCVAYALLAGLFARMVVLPEGPLAAAPLWARLLAVAIGFAVLRASRGRLLVAVLAGAGALVAITLATG